MSYTSRRIRINYKTETCRCGCAGSDPWHRRHYIRSIKLASPHSLEGTVKLPFSTKPVRVFVPKWAQTGRETSPGAKYWVIDTNSITHDKR